MQRIIRDKDYKYIHPVFADLEKFYAMTSTKVLQSTTSLIPQVFDESFKSLQNLFSIYGGVDYHCKFEDKHYTELDLPEYDDNNVILTFSGGKDSTATALWYVEHGYNVYLYHLQNINQPYPDEWKRAKEVADYLGLPLYIDKIKFEGRQEHTEHPMKNMMIANNAIKWGIDNNIGTSISFGNYTNVYLDDTPFYIAGGDCVDMWAAYEGIVAKIIPDFQIFMELESLNDTFELLAKDKKLLELCQSCLGAHRFREYNRKWVADKYNYPLMAHRCGVCWKCAAEYIYMADHDVFDYNEEYYKHCLDILKRTDKKENGRTFENVESLWQDFFTYDIMKSKWSGIMDYGKKKRRGK